MGKYEVRIIARPAQRMAFVNTVSDSPEQASFYKLMTWAKEKGLAENQSCFRWFGRNNPPPEKGKTEYGYDAMITIPDGITPDGEIRLFDLPEWKYAVVRCGIADIGRMWNFLYDWVKNSEYEIADHGLEELLNPFCKVDEYVFDLWLPVKK